MLAKYGDSIALVVVGLVHLQNTNRTIRTFIRILWHHLLDLAAGLIIPRRWLLFLEFLMDLLKLSFHDHDSCTFPYFCLLVLNIR